MPQRIGSGVAANAGQHAAAVGAVRHATTDRATKIGRPSTLYLSDRGRRPAETPNRVPPHRSQRPGAGHRRISPVPEPKVRELLVARVVEPVGKRPRAHVPPIGESAIGIRTGACIGTARERRSSVGSCAPRRTDRSSAASRHQARAQPVVNRKFTQVIGRPFALPRASSVSPCALVNGRA